MKQTHSRFLRTAAACIALTLTAASAALPVFADEPYEVYNYNYLGEAVPSQAGYLAERSVSGSDLGAGAFNKPSDLLKDAQNYFYVVDSGNHRIVKIDPAFTEATAVWTEFSMPDGTKTTLKEPKGIYISPDTGLIYIADSGNARILVADRDLHVQMEITKPTSAVYDQELTFLPQKILCDKAGNIYVVLGNTTKGAAMFGADGSFLGYYGANSVRRTADVIANHFWNAIASEEEKRYRTRNTPSAFDNFDIDFGKGFIFTSTSSASNDTDIVKKVNPEGHNLFSYMSDFVWGDQFSTWYSGTSYQTQIVDLDIGDDGSINCLDAAAGRVFQYDGDANLLFIMGTTGDQVGAFPAGGAVAVETKGSECEEIYVLDGVKGTVTIFEQNEFGAIVHEANALYQDGYYEEALTPWFEVLKRDGSYRSAYLGIASAYYNMGRFQESMDYAKKADSSKRYNRAFAQYRAQWMKAYFGQVLAFTVLLILLCILRKLRRKNRLQEQTS